MKKRQFIPTIKHLRCGLTLKGYTPVPKRWPFLLVATIVFGGSLMAVILVKP